MKTTKASTNATTYEEYLKLREEELMEERDHWIKAWKDMYKENAELKARVTVAEMGLEELENYGKELEADVNTLQVKLAAREEYIESQEANIRFLKRACGWNN
jgi:hypothetical protein